MITTEIRLVLHWKPDATDAEKSQVTRLLTGEIQDIVENEFAFTQLGDMLDDYILEASRA
jgi:hypothetical protein